MTLVRNRPNRWMMDDDFVGSIDRLFDQISAPALGPTRSVGESHPFDLYETDEALVLQMAVPGSSADDLDLSIESRQLTVRASLADDQAEDRRYWAQGIPRGETTRSIKLPATVDADAIEARVDNGLLTLTMPKVQEAKVKKIAISRE